MFVDFQIVGDAFALRTSAKNQLIRWMVHAKVLHGVLLRSESVTMGRVKRESLCGLTTFLWVAQIYRPEGTRDPEGEVDAGPLKASPPNPK